MNYNQDAQPRIEPPADWWETVDEYDRLCDEADKRRWAEREEGLP